MQTPRFSILVANYNNGKYLLECVQSVQRQTMSSWEVVIVDDGSTDVSQAIYEQLRQDERVRVFYNEQNRGCGFTKNRCVQQARGEWCAFLDPDDALREDALQIFSEHIDRLPQYGVFFSHMYVCDTEMNIRYSNTYTFGSPEWQEFIHYQKGIPLFCFKKGEYLSTQGIHLNLTQSVDIDLYWKMSEVTEFYYINEPLYYYRNNPVSLTKNRDMATATHLWVMLESLKRQGKTEQEIQQEIAGFYRWRTKPLQEKISKLENDRFYRIGQKIRKIKRWLTGKK